MVCVQAGPTILNTVREKTLALLIQEKHDLVGNLINLGKNRGLRA